MSRPKLEMIDCDIVDAETLVNQRAIAILEECLEEAKKGEIREVLVVGIGSDESSNIGWTPTLSFIKRLGMLELVKLTWVKEYLSDPDDSQ